LCGPTQAGGDTLRWLSACFYSEFMPAINYDKMEAEARSAPAGSDGLVFLPYLNGERAPLWDLNARGAFIGLTFHHDRRHCTRAVYEGIGFAIRHILEISEKAAGRKANELVICGGGSRSSCSAPFGRPLSVKPAVWERPSWHVWERVSILT
jgi:sugar (pentulose or hexulose) kinase